MTFHSKIAVSPNGKVLQRQGLQCAHCSLQRVCLPAHLAGDDLAEFEALVSHPEVVDPGENLFSENDGFRNLYAVRAGAIKSIIRNHDEAQIVGFSLPGDFLGFHAIYSGHYSFTAEVIEPAYVCSIDYFGLMKMVQSNTQLSRQFIALMSRQLTQEQNTIHSLGQKSAESRFAGLLLTFSEHYRQRGFSASEFWLPVSRQEMSNYLSLAVETVSRLFSRFQQQGLLKVKGRHIDNLNIQAMNELAGFGEELKSRSANSA